MCWLTELFKRPSSLELSPSDWMPAEAISVADANVMVDTSKLIPGLSKPPKVWIPPVPEYKDPTKGSMLPNFSHEHNNILIAGASKADHIKIIGHLQVGDIAVYRIMEKEGDSPDDFSKPNVPYGYAIHRIIDIGTGAQGRHFTFKGDNNSVKDPYPVYPKNILWASIGTIF